MYLDYKELKKLNDAKLRCNTHNKTKISSVWINVNPIAIFIPTGTQLTENFQVLDYNKFDTEI